MLLPVTGRFRGRRLCWRVSAEARAVPGLDEREEVAEQRRGAKAQIKRAENAPPTPPPAQGDHRWCGMGPGRRGTRPRRRMIR
jgi:hypothetical protein